jgi:hypothetical protein
MVLGSTIAIEPPIFFKVWRRTVAASCDSEMGRGPFQILLVNYLGTSQRFSNGHKRNWDGHKRDCFLGNPPLNKPEKIGFGNPIAVTPRRLVCVTVEIPRRFVPRDDTESAVPFVPVLSPFVPVSKRLRVPRPFRDFARVRHHQESIKIPDRTLDHFMPIPCGRAGPVENAVLKSMT